MSKKAAMPLCSRHVPIKGLSKSKMAMVEAIKFLKLRFEIKERVCQFLLLFPS